MTPELFSAQTAAIQAVGAFLYAEGERCQEECPELVTPFEKLSLLCMELETLTPADDATYGLREKSLSMTGEMLTALSARLTQDKLSALEYNGVAIDLELVRFYLFGREVAAASKL